MKSDNHGMVPAPGPPSDPFLRRLYVPLFKHARAEIPLALAVAWLREQGHAENAVVRHPRPRSAVLANASSRSNRRPSARRTYATEPKRRRRRTFSTSLRLIEGRPASSRTRSSTGPDLHAARSSPARLPLPRAAERGVCDEFWGSARSVDVDATGVEGITVMSKVLLEMSTSFGRLCDRPRRHSGGAHGLRRERLHATKRRNRCVDYDPDVDALSATVPRNVDVPAVQAAAY